MRPELLRKLGRVARSYEFTWRYLYNFGPTVSYKLSSQRPTGEVARVLNDLNRNGVAITSAEKLLGPSSAFSELSAAVDNIEHNLADKLKAARELAHQRDPYEQEKIYLYELLGSRPVLDPNDIFVRFALQKPILQIANAYLGMYARFRFFNVWHNFTTNGRPSRSQLWHSDRDDLYYIFKMFVYLSDVDDGAGPFTYAAGTHHKGKARKEPPYFLEDGQVKRSNDSQMAEAVPEDQWIKCTGPKGTIVFADTHGYHKGGLSRDSDRILYTCMFTAPSAQPYQEKELFVRPHTISLPSDKEQAFALATRS